MEEDTPITCTIGEVTISTLKCFTKCVNVFPMGKQILGRYLQLVRRGDGGGSLTKRSAVTKIAKEVKSIWDRGYVPSISERKMEGRINRVVADYQTVLKDIHNKDKNSKPKFLSDLSHLTARLESVMDMKLPDEEIASIEKESAIQYGEEEKALYEDQMSKKFEMRFRDVDPAWLPSHQARVAELQAVADRREKRLEEERKRAEKEAMRKEMERDCFVKESDLSDMDIAGDEEARTENEPKQVGVEPDSSKGSRRVVWTQGRKRRLESEGEIPVLGPEVHKVRDSYSAVRNDVYDFLISFMADASASSHQCIIAAKNFAKHILKVTWLTQKEAKEEREKAELAGTTLPDDFIDYVLPSETAIEGMRKNYAIAAEKKTSELILDLPSDVPITHHGDSTTRTMVGKIFTNPLTVGSNLHLNLPLQQLTSETSEDVADVYQVTYDRMAILTGKTPKEIYEAMDDYMTDGAKEMDNFISILQNRFQSEHRPVRFECVMHTVLGFSNSQLKVLSAIEQTIGPTLLHGSAKCHDANNVVKSTVNAMMKFVSPQFLQKPYNRKREFDAMLKSKGLKVNDMFSFRESRFGALEKACIVVVYLWDEIVELSDHIDSRNELMSFLRTVMECPFIKHMIIALALIGLHLIEPFVSLVQCSNHVQLQSELPRLFAELQKHEEIGKKAVSTSVPALQSLGEHFGKVQEKGVYKERWVQALQSEIDALDDDSLESIQNVLGLFSFHNAEVLQRQRGSAYGFGVKTGIQKDSVSLLPIHKLSQVPVTNLRAENEFGSIDTVITRLRTTSVRCVSEHRILRSSGGMVYGTGCAREVQPYLQQLKAVQSAFDDRQMKKKSDSVLAMCGKAKQQEKRVLLLTEACKKYGGPWTCASEVTGYVASCVKDGVSEAEMKKGLKAHLILARETFTKRPKTDLLLRVRDSTTRKDLTAKQFENNLVTLYSNVMAVADVPSEVVKGALQKAVAAAGISYISSEKANAVGVVPEFAQGARAASLIDSPQDDHFVMERVAFVFLDEQGKKDWCLAMIDTKTDDGFELSLFRPVPGRMGENRVVFYPPEETQLITACSSDILPIPLIVTESLLDKEVVFVVNNHEEVDGFLKVVRQF